MPEEIVGPIAGQVPSFAAVEDLARRCGTSLTASAYRLVERTGHALAVVWSEHGRVRWYRRSGEFRRSVRVDALAPETVAADYFRGIGPPNDWVEVPAEAWLYPDGLLAGATLREWTRALPSYGATLSLLFVEQFLEARHDYQESDDGSLDPDEFGLARRRWPGKH